MSPTVIGVAVFACAFGGALLGMALRRALPAHHLDEASKDTIKIGVGLVATMTALLLGLVTASAKSSFDDVDAAVKTSAAEVLALDRALARYGPETADIRLGLKQAVATRIGVVESSGTTRPQDLDPMSTGSGAETERLTEAIRSLKPRDDVQRSLQSRALDLAETMLQVRWMVFASGGSPVPVPFLVIIVFWLTVTFMSFGLFAPTHLTVITVLLVCAASVASALFLVIELGAPFDGLIRVSLDPLRYALAHMNR